MWRDPDEPKTYEGKIWKRTAEIAILRLLGISANDCSNCIPDGGHTSKAADALYYAYKLAEKQIPKKKEARK